MVDKELYFGITSTLKSQWLCWSALEKKEKIPQTQESLSWAFSLPGRKGMSRIKHYLQERAHFNPLVWTALIESWSWEARCDWHADYHNAAMANDAVKWANSSCKYFHAYLKAFAGRDCFDDINVKYTQIKRKLQTVVMCFPPVTSLRSSTQIHEGPPWLYCTALWFSQYWL